MPEQLKAERPYPLPPDEPERLAALRALQLVNTPPDEAFDRIIRLARILFRTKVAVFSLVDDEHVFFKSILGHNAESVPREDSLATYAILQESPMVVLDTGMDPRFSRLGYGSFVRRFSASVPVQTLSGHRVGVLSILDDKPWTTWGAVQSNILKDLGELISNVMQSGFLLKEQENMRQEIKRLMSQSPSHQSVDKLTGLPDRRSLETIVAHAKAVADETDRFVALVYMDLDGLSDVNEQYGEETGDEVIKALAVRLKNAVRMNDFVVRIAGDQFLIVLLGLQLIENVQRPLRSIFEAIRKPISLQNNQTIQMTMSAGLAYYPHSGSTAVELVKASRDAMLASKDAGGNVCAVSLPGKDISFLAPLPEEPTAGLRSVPPEVIQTSSPVSIN